MIDIKNITISCVNNDDIESLCEFEKEARTTEPAIWGWEFVESEYKEKLKSLNINKLDNSKIIVAKLDNKIIGRCDIAIITSLVECSKTGYVDWIYTLKAYRGLGIGKKLLKGAEKYFKSQCVEYYFLFTASNEQAQEFYHRQSDLSFKNREVAEKAIVK